MGTDGLAERLVAGHGRTFAEDAGIVLRDEPDELWQLFVLVQLLSARISSDIAVASVRQLFTAGCGSPAGLRATSWRQRVDALGRGGYRRYDFSTATRLGDNAAMLQGRWRDDLRRLRDDVDGDPRRIATLLRRFDGIGPTGAAIFLREVQAVWPGVRPLADPLVLKGAGLAGLPQNAAGLAALVPPERFANLCAALVRVARRPALLGD